MILCCPTYAILNAQVVDSIGDRTVVDRFVDVGGHELHFHILKGKASKRNATAILFESGGGDDATTWKNMLQPVSDATGATLITYDRAGFGKSGFDTRKHGILNEVMGLETGLKKLGFKGDLILVAHSLGGFYATLFAARNRQKVKGAVFIDANLACFFTDEHFNKNRSENEGDMKRLEADKKWGAYYIYANMEPNVPIASKSNFSIQDSGSRYGRGKVPFPRRIGF
ncbi:MAG TPA: alpha/beta fold hydrolase [Candidatus Angelobacter sp.]|nr:alpha/beta fold hydrolase [Candidatus Angelobacter sp.]